MTLVIFCAVSAVVIVILSLLIAVQDVWRLGEAVCALHERIRLKARELDSLQERMIPGGADHHRRE